MVFQKARQADLKKNYLVRYKFKKIVPTRVRTGYYALIAIKFSWITLEQLQACEFFLRRRIRRKGHFFFHIFPSQVRSFKPLGSRMGKGKGRLLKLGLSVYPGLVICEVSDSSMYDAYLILLYCSAKLRGTFKVVNSLNQWL